MRSRRQQYQMAFEPVYEDTGTPYPCSPRHLATYRHSPGPNLQGPVSVATAVREIVNHNSEMRRDQDFDQAEWAAQGRLSDGINRSETSGWGPDLIIKMFADLDLVFFNGKLLGNVQIKWQNISPGVLGDTAAASRYKANIRLNPQAIFLDPSIESPFKHMFSTMLHEMIHAYRNVRCHPSDRGAGDGHDAPFRTMIHSVHRRAYDCLGIAAISKEEDYIYHHDMSDQWAGERGGGPLGARDDGDPAPEFLFRGDGAEPIPIGGRFGGGGNMFGSPPSFGGRSPLGGRSPMGGRPPLIVRYPSGGGRSPFGSPSSFGGSMGGRHGGIPPLVQYGGFYPMGGHGRGHSGGPRPLAGSGRIPPGCW